MFASKYENKKFYRTFFPSTDRVKKSTLTLFVSPNIWQKLVCMVQIKTSPNMYQSISCDQKDFVCKIWP